jgi:hypothetical protein
VHFGVIFLVGDNVLFCFLSRTSTLVAALALIASTLFAGLVTLDIIALVLLFDPFVFATLAAFRASIAIAIRCDVTWRGARYHRRGWHDTWLLGRRRTVGWHFRRRRRGCLGRVHGHKTIIQLSSGPAPTTTTPALPSTSTSTFTP